MQCQVIKGKFKIFFAVLPPCTCYNGMYSETLNGLTTGRKTAFLFNTKFFKKMSETYVIKMTPVTACNLEPRKNLLVNGKKIHTAIDAMGTKYYNLEDVVKCLGMADEENVPSQILDEKERYVFSVVNYPAELKQDGKFIAIFGTLLEVTRILIDAAKDIDSPDRQIFYNMIDAIYSNK